MPDFSSGLTRPGDINNAGVDPFQTFLKVFPGDVYAAFRRANKMLAMTAVRNISHGSSAQFMGVGKATSEYHTPGTALTGNPINTAERIIHVDQRMVSHTHVDDVDEAMVHWEVRSQLAAALAEVLSVNVDSNILIQMVLTARTTTPVVTGLPGGSAITNANMKTDSDVLAAAFFDAAQTMDENDVPEMGRFGVLKPAQYALLAQNTKILNRDWDGAGSYSRGQVPVIADISVVKSNNLPTTNILTSPTGTRNDYSGNFTTTAGVIGRQESVGTVILRGLEVQREYRVSNQGTLLVARILAGHGKLREDQTIELATA